MVNLLNFIKEMMVTGLGALFLTKDKVEEMVQKLVEEGKVSKEEANELINNMTKKAKEQQEQMRDKIKTEIENSFNKVGIVKREEVEELKDKVVKLELHVRSLEREIQSLKNDGIEVAEDDS